MEVRISNTLRPALSLTQTRPINSNIKNGYLGYNYLLWPLIIGAAKITKATRFLQYSMIFFASGFIISIWQECSIKVPP